MSFIGKDGRKFSSIEELVPELSEEKLRSVTWNCRDVYNIDIYINAAFRSSLENQVYIFMGNEYVLLHYDPTMTHDDHQMVLNGPDYIRRGFRGLAGTGCGDRGIDCAFGSVVDNQAFLFYGGYRCVKMEYAPGTTDIKILEATTIARMFPFLKGTRFQRDVDAAFESSVVGEAYLFKGSKHALINYRDGCLIANNLTFNCLKDTIFENGIGAAFASHRTDEAYIFKEDFYALINFAGDYIVGGVKKILPHGWPSLNGIYPRKNIGYIPSDDEVDDEVGSSEEEF